MAITDKETVKMFLGITSTTYDERIEALISQVEDDYLRIRGVAWDEDSNDNIEYPDNADSVASMMIGHMLSSMTFSDVNYGNKMSESIGSYSYTKGANKEKMIHGYPEAIVKRIGRYQRAN